MSKRFWKGKKRLAKKYLGNRIFNMLFDNGVPKVGDLTHDCDGFNHIITRVSIEYDIPMSWGLSKKLYRFFTSSSSPKGKFKSSSAKGKSQIHRTAEQSRRQIRGVKIPYIETYYPSKYTEDGVTKEYEHSVCGCQGIGWQRPLPREEIESWALLWTKMKEQQIAGGWGWDPVCDTWTEIILSGGHIVCEKGLRQ